MSETVTMTITDFLLARYAEDEDCARQVFDGAREKWATYCDTVAERHDAGSGWHMLRWHPARVLAECEAKRRIVELHRGDHECSTYNHLHGEVDNCAWVLGGDCSTMRLLALPFADHPDYREEWKP